MRSHGVALDRYADADVVRCGDGDVYSLGSGGGTGIGKPPFGLIHVRNPASFPLKDGIDDVSCVFGSDAASMVSAWMPSGISLKTISFAIIPSITNSVRAGSPRCIDPTLPGGFARGS